jgi:2-isopropylmalate synthase
METEIKIFDTTLRDGEQTPGVAFAVPDKIRIAQRLHELGVHVIEAGFPVNSPEEFDAVRQIAESVETQVCGLARVVLQDIEAALRAGVDMVHVFVSTSEIQIEKSMHTTRSSVREKTRTAIQHVKDAGKICMYSPMDATRTDSQFLVEICQIAEKAGADWINLPDTVGVSTPKSIAAMVERVRAVIKIPISIHCHNDFGLAVANSLAAVEAGARMVQVTLNGIGERAGNAALEEVVMGLRCLHGFRDSIRTEKIYEISRLIERLTGICVTPNKPIIGANAFSHESGIHAAGVLEDYRTFEPGVMTPEMVGHRRRLVVGKHTGKHGVKKELEDAGLCPSGEELDEIVQRVKSLGGKGRRVLSADLFAIAESVMQSLPEAERAFVLEQIVVTTGNRVTPTASVVARVNGQVRTEAQTGVGPVDAALKAVQRMLGAYPHLEIEEFHIDAISGGSDAVAKVSVTVEEASGKRCSAEAAHEDTVIASVEALIAAVNHLMRLPSCVSMPEKVV